ncbi:DNA/RNA non-specific endonuclease [Clostridium felsineum]|uniref:DNA/RNA non-specific endonuclease n=1 Tax=Clostridium felsineum TaxID=36839 RepID=UPI00098CDC13|nr:DNA/RNA non-specific endonuclease [Clostridium felsineum]URZ04254.1 hypothetical protein CLAUR_043420 [Clostridium felsineum]
MKKKIAILLLACSVFSSAIQGLSSNVRTYAASSHLVISEIYGGGGNSGSSYKNDFIEIYNPTSSTVDLSGWSVQYASASGSFNNITNLSGSIDAHKYFLIKEASGIGGTVDLPNADATGDINLSATNGKVALAKDTTSVSGPEDSNVVDFVGYGSADESETSSVGALSNTTCAERKDDNGTEIQGQGNGWDTDNNSEDFYITSNLNPQNSSSQGNGENNNNNNNNNNTGKDNDNMLLGNPSGATSDISNSNNYLMAKPQYDFSYNNSKHEPNWTSWHLDSSNLGGVRRQDDFRPDTTLPLGWYEVTASEFSGTGFDRGHMCPSGDRTNSISDNQATFFMDNMIPQAPNNNEITWEKLEEYERTLVSEGNELYIMDGGYGMGGTGSHGYMTTVGNNVVVPAKTWKIIVVLPNGTNDVSRITNSTRVISVVIPNDQACSSKPWTSYRVSVNTIQSLTGYNFLSAVPTNIRNVIESKVDNGATN